LPRSREFEGFATKQKRFILLVGAPLLDVGFRLLPPDEELAVFRQPFAESLLSQYRVFICDAHDGVAGVRIVFDAR